MGSVTPNKWTAEVAIDEPDRSSLPGWSIGHLKGSVTNIDVEPGSAPLTNMVEWLGQHSTGAWRFVERERVSGRTSLLYRTFEFEQSADAILFATAWWDALVQMRVESVDRQIASVTSASANAGGVQFLDRALTWLLDETPLRLRARSLMRLRGKSSHRQIGELVARIEN